MTLNMYVATIAWLCLLIGFLAWKHRRTHLIFVLAGISIDIGLVLYLQVTRSAIQTALSFGLDPLQQVHIGVSTLALVLYFPALYYAIRLLRNQKGDEVFTAYKRVIIPAFVLRCFGFLFMFSMWHG